MNILVYENSAGFSSYTHKVCNAICDVNSDNDIVYMTQRDNKEIHSLNEKINLKSVLFPYDNSSKGTIKWLINRVGVSIKNIRMRNKEIKAHKYDVVSIQATIPIVDQFFIKKACKNAKVVYTVHDVIPPTKSFYYSNKSLKKMYNTVDHLIVHSEKNKEQLIELFNIEAEKISVVFHGTETNYNKLNMDECRERFGIDKEKTVFLFYGMIREQKGLTELIKAMKDVPNAQLVIAGAMPFGESFDEYQKLLDENKVDCIKYIQYIPYEWTDELFQSCDAVCLPYRYFYSQSGVFMQCIQYRKPVVISDVAAFGEYLSNYNMGVLVKPGDVADLHEKLMHIQDIIKNDNNQYGAGLEKAAAENSWEKSAEKYLQVFSGV